MDGTEKGGGEREKERKEGKKRERMKVGFLVTLNEGRSAKVCSSFVLECRRVSVKI